ncbi:hypothetical protein RUM44_000506 [Polyplax serrata]|uniref:Uncharacterized protein n=1 Tax=Polyplax serrata TaxID=468196 RepID=A0ABR1B5M1_POLSC
MDVLQVVEKYTTGHQMKIIMLLCTKDYLFTYGVDGLVIITQIPANKCATVFACHHRLVKGVQSVIVDPYMKYVITRGGNGSLVCTLLKKLAKMTMKQEYEAMMVSPQFRQVFLNPIMSEKAKAKALEKLFQNNPEQAKGVVDMQKTKVWDKVWLEVREEETINLEEQRSRKERLSVFEEFESLRDKLKQLLDQNYANPPERQLPVQAFDLDKATRRKKLEDGKTEREKERQIEMALVKNLNKITDIIKKVCWESVNIKSREIHGILSPTVVQSYALLPESPPPKLNMNWLTDRLHVEQFFRTGDFFEPWIPRDESSLELHINRKFQVSSVDITETIKTKFKEEHLDEDKTNLDTDDEKPKLVWAGTSSHNFIQVDPNHYNQFELNTFFQAHQEVRMIEMDIKKLMLWFNKEFKDIFAQKEQEMTFINNRNDRFRHIISELSFFHFCPNICKTQIYDPQWAPTEIPTKIMTVEDEEVSVEKYISESETELINTKKQEEEKLRMMLMADDFKEKALGVMMDGVLEKLWEDEIKKDAVKPKCMVEKEPETWTEDDLKAIKLYEEAVKVLLIERDRYKKILEERWAKTIVAVKDSVAKFDDKVLKLHFLKLKVESAIGQESLKGLRIRQRCFQRIEMDRKEESIKLQLVKNEKKIETMTTELNKLVDVLNDCKNYYENLQNKDRNLDKNFKREFPEYSPIICEQLYKMSKKRPKLLQKAAVYSTVLIDMGKCAVMGNKPEYLPVECIQYLKDIDALDAHSNAPASVSQQSWELACRMRRTKIETELKIKACAIDLADAEATVMSYQKALKACKDYQGQLQNDLQLLRAEKLNTSLNSQIQLVMKKGLVEVPLSGQISDFAECILVTRDTLNQVNKSIQRMGQQKIKAMQKAANFRKGIIYKEWEHKKLRMEIEDLKSQLDTVEKLQVVKELQAILVARARGFTDEKGFVYVENEISKVKQKYQKLQTDIFSKIDDLNLKIEKLNSRNLELNDRIEELNIEVNELDLGRDKDFDEKNLAANQKRYN